MDSSTGFFEFIFSEGLKDPKAAYKSLHSNPYQIFDILLREEHFTNFFSRIEVYGNNLAYLLSQFPNFRKDDYSSLLLQETIRAFTLSLLAERLDDMKSRSAAARIVVSVVKLSHPRALRQFGARLGALPGILRVLVLEGYMRELLLTHKQCFEGLISEPQAGEQWVKFIVDFCKGCEVHKSGPRRINGVELAKFIRTVPCRSCTSSISFDYGLGQGTEVERARPRGNRFVLTAESSVFRSLLGEPLGLWKVILSQHAIENLETASAQGDFEDILRKLSELASGDWAGREILHKAKWNNSLGYRLPLFKAFYKTGRFILWQIDTAFDERFEEDFQVIKGLSACEISPSQYDLDKIVEQIHRAQQAYTKARVNACNRDDLDGSRGIRNPVRVCLGTRKSSDIPVEVDGTSAGNFDGSGQLAKFYGLTTTVRDNITLATGRVAYPVDISAEEARVVDHFLPPAFILGRSGTGKTTCLVYKLVGRYLLYTSGREKPLRQVLLTKSKRLVEKLRVNTSGLLEAKLGKRERPTNAIDDFDDNTRKTFSSLTDADFPLVCTFDYLLRLIENSIREQESQRRYIKIESSKCTGTVDFRKFNIEYWKPMNQGIKKGIPVEIAFLEIVEVIKGSASQATNFKPLSWEEYSGRHSRKTPTFVSERERGAVYSLYEWYERAKKKRGDIDQVDRVLKVMQSLEAFKSSGIPEDIVFEQKIWSMLDEIYVDAGDTAQCISKDALFRFPNAEALFYERFMDSIRNDEEIKPILLPLSHNLRSHQQILNVASVVMDLLYRGFPGMVDKLPPEVGDIPGPKPTLYDVLKFEEKMETPQKPDAQNGGSIEYGEALRCFEDAGDPDGITLANAYITEEKGFVDRAHGLSQVANSHFLKASELFLQVGSFAKAVQCQKEGGDSKGAIRILAENGAHEDAAWLGVEVGLSQRLSLAVGNKEQEIALSRFHLMNKLFDFLNTNRRYVEAYEVGNLVTKSKLGTGGTAEHGVFDWYKTSVETGMLGDVQIAGYVDILVTRIAHPNNELQPPLDHIKRVLEGLSIMSSHGNIPSWAQLYCGVYETPRQSGKCVALDWSPFYDKSKPRLPLRPVDIESLRDRILGHILGDIVPPLISLDEELRVMWSAKAKSQFVPPSTLKETHLEKVAVGSVYRGFAPGPLAYTVLVTGIPLRDIFEISCNDRGQQTSQGFIATKFAGDWRFRGGALLEQMEFRSSYEQSLEGLFETKSDLVTRDGRYHDLYSILIGNDTTEYRIELALQMDVGACVSSLLSQYQTSLFLGYEDKWRLALLEMRARIINRGNSNLRCSGESRFTELLLSTHHCPLRGTFPIFDFPGAAI
ncbi:hypothetical protein C7212DRAFT_340031 [Tuber magnatum]|uniref:UvrD-like helicase ATP-binding domain-containing protein n=1 Tax=Tuber magnatum TaxID=42249 RepID=A0A317T075_9PEZI|nr:hypothetical protein C7212DRAFT_340031 [Tuber magnatum]